MKNYMLDGILDNRISVDRVMNMLNVSNGMTKNARTFRNIYIYIDITYPIFTQRVLDNYHWSVA